MAIETRVPHEATFAPIHVRQCRRCLPVENIRRVRLDAGQGDFPRGYRNLPLKHAPKSVRRYNSADFTVLQLAGASHVLSPPLSFQW